MIMLHFNTVKNSTNKHYSVRILCLHTFFCAVPMSQHETLIERTKQPAFASSEIAFFTRGASVSLHDLNSARRHGRMQASFHVKSVLEVYLSLSNHRDAFE